MCAARNLSFTPPAPPPPHKKILDPPLINVQNITFSLGGESKLRVSSQNGLTPFWSIWDIWDLSYWNKENNKKICNTFVHNFKNIPLYIMRKVLLERYYFVLYDGALGQKWRLTRFAIKTLQIYLYQQNEIKLLINNVQGNVMKRWCVENVTTLDKILKKKKNQCLWISTLEALTCNISVGIRTPWWFF